jgi:LacI family transcriptional regulator
VITIRDVAREAGVSIATVSRALNGSTRVNDGTLQRVREAAAKLDYWPNGAARSLTSSRTHTLGILLPDLFGEFFSEVIRGIDQTARDETFQLLISSSHADTDTMLASARTMSGRIDGLIAMAPDKGSVEAIARIARQFPVVLISPRNPVPGCSSVSIANVDGAAAMTAHLLDLGHRRIAMVRGPRGNVDADERLRGYREALRRAGRGPRAARGYQGAFTEASGYRAAEEILRRRSRPSAVFAANDNMAIGILSALRDRGVEVPGEMAVTGFDDLAIAEYLSPSLTTVHVDAYGLGSRAVSLWMTATRSRGRRRSRHEVLPATLVLRRSCGGLRAGAKKAGGTNGRGGNGDGGNGDGGNGDGATLTARATARKSRAIARSQGLR